MNPLRNLVRVSRLPRHQPSTSTLVTTQLLIRYAVMTLLETSVLRLIVYGCHKYSRNILTFKNIKH